MADNVTLNLGSGGSIVATDEVGGAHYQYVKLAYGANNTATIVDVTNALPIDLRRINGDAISVGIGSSGDGTIRVVLATDSPGLVVEDAASVGGERAMLLAGVRNDAAATKTSTDGDFGCISLDLAGRVLVGTSGNTLRVDVVTLNNATIDLGTGNVGLGTQRVVLASNQPVIPVGDNGGSLTVDGTVSVSGTVTVSGTVAIGASIPAGTNNIGDVDVLTLPATASEGGALPSVFAVVAADDGTDVHPLQIDNASGALKVMLAGSIPDFNLATVADNGVATGAGNTDVGTLRVVLATNQSDVAVKLIPQTSGGVSIHKRISTGDTNGTNVKGSAGQVYGFTVTNLNAAARYFKLYNKATAPTVGTDVPIATYLVPGNTAGAGIRVAFEHGLAFSTGIGFGLTTGVADNNSGAVAVDELVVNLEYK